MNIFANVIIVTDLYIKDKIKDNFLLTEEYKSNDIEVFFKNKEEYSIVLVYVKNKDFKNGIEYVKEKYEITKLFYLGTSQILMDTDLRKGDIIIPNTLLYKNNNTIFFENLVEKSYDLNQFGLILNGICLTVDTKVYDRKNKIAQIYDYEAFHLGKVLQENDLIQNSHIIKIVGTDEDYFNNGINILELMI